ncbi:MAG: tRNA (guanine(10)-N(2))-dimethyltransferase [Methanobacteriaceae archaeon]|nr:tRNA (guanine(10)-N(2))-dimethyltransferase [Methanobacteriaceae archaeon]
MDVHNIYEGEVTIEVPDFEKVSSKAPVFYNPVMQLNRDMSIVVINQYRKLLDHDISICDAFGGTGIRGVRYAKEIEGVTDVTICDVNPLAIDIANKNIMLNNLDNVETLKNDANIVLHSNKGLFDVIDIDPFGSPSKYTQATAANIRPGGLICITATDTSALCGTYHDPCYRKYSAKPLKTAYCHENGIRILIAHVARNLAIHQKYLHVLFSHSTEHYMRFYATIDNGGKRTNRSLNNIGFITNCSHCLEYNTHHGYGPFMDDKCPICDNTLEVAGPMWLGNIIDKDFLKNMIESLDDLKLNTKEEINELLLKCFDEADGSIGFYDIHKICKVLKISSPKFQDVMDAIKDHGYFISRTHFKPTGMKTNMPLAEIKDLIIKIRKENYSE